MVVPTSHIRESIRTEVAKVLAEVPPGKTGAMVAVATPVGVNLAVAAKMENGWEVVGWVGKSWGKGKAIDYGAQVKKTWGVLLALLLWPSLVSGQILERAVEITNGVALAAHAADGMSTVRCTVAATCQEANPWIRPFVGGADPKPVAFYAVKMGTAFGSYVVKNWLKRDHPTWTLVLGVAESAAFFGIAAHNNAVHERALARRAR